MDEEREVGKELDSKYCLYCYSAGSYDKPQCEADHENFYCSRRAGHGGNHVACAPGYRHEIVEWEQTLEEYLLQE